MATYTAKGFIGEIRQAPPKAQGDDAKYFVSLSIPLGNKDKGNRKYQFMSVYVSKILNRLFMAAIETQEKDEDGKIINTLSSQIAELIIEEPFFEIKDGYLNGTGILVSVSFQGTAPQHTSKGATD